MAENVPSYDGGLTQRLFATTDAQTWAHEFMQIKNSMPAVSEGTEEAWMLTWFANAIEVGRAAGGEAGRNSAAADALSQIITARRDGFTAGYSAGYDDGYTADEL
jgi:hypothetical protein